MIKLNLICWFGFHKFNKSFCTRCGYDRITATETVIFEQPRGQTQFVESVSDKERFEQAENIDDLIK